MLTKDVEAHFGTLYAAAKALGINRQAAYQWGPLVPELSARKLHELTKGKLRFDPEPYAKDAA